MSECKRCNCDCDKELCKNCHKIIEAAEKERLDISYRYMRKNGTV